MPAVHPELAKHLSDPRRFIRRPDRAVFDEHEEHDGKKKVRSFSKAHLEKIARNSNERDRKGQPCPITIGHTDPDNPDEKAQPEIVGYARHFKVRYDKVLDRWTLRADFFIRRERMGEAEDYPRVSVELWPQALFIGPVALLKRTPQRDVGQWTYIKHGSQQVLRYRMQEQPMTDEDFMLDADMHAADPLAEPMPPVDDADPMGAPAEEVPADGLGDEPQMSPGEMAEQFMKDMCAHPHFKKLSEHYSMPEEAAPEMPDMPDGPAPTEEPDADAEPAPYSMGYASGTNAVPALTPPAEEPKRHSRKEAEAVVDALAREFALDREEEVARYMRVGPEKFAKRAEQVRKFNRPCPAATGPGRPLQTGKAQKPKRGLDAITIEELEKAKQYMRANGVDMVSAMKKVMGLPIKG